MRITSTRAMTISAMLTATSLLAACTTLPDSSNPEAISTYAPTPTQDNVPEPVQNQPSDLMLRDFFAASAHPSSDHQAAKKFLTDKTAQRWQGTGSAMILDRMDIASEGEASRDKITYRVRGNIIGTLGIGGVFNPEYTAFETTYELTRVNGEWRISNLPDAVVLDRQDFMGAYQPRDIYFLGSQTKELVPDRRWVYNRQQSMAASLVSLLVAGPNPRLAGAITRTLPKDATAQVAQGESGGYNVEFSGLKDLNAQQRQELAAQVIWTLVGADIRGPYGLFADGAPLSDQDAGKWRVQDVSQFNPTAEADVPLRTLASGVLYEEDNGQSRRMSGWINNQYLESVAVSPQENIFAAVVGRGEEKRTLEVGGANDQPQRVVEADALTRPSWSSDATALYTVADGKRVIRLNRTPNTGEVTAQAVDTSAVDNLQADDQRISVFRVSHDGARAVMLIQGKIYVSVISRNSKGDVSLGKPEQVGHQLGDTAVSADWTADGTILVGTRANDAPIWSVALDGSVSNQLSGRNLSAPVVAVASNGRVIYATDARALMQFNYDSQSTRFWREVPSMQGQRAMPVLGY